MLLFDLFVEGAIEYFQDFLPDLFSFGNGIQLLLDICRELVVNDIRKMFFQKINDDERNIGRLEFFLVIARDVRSSATRDARMFFMADAAAALAWLRESTPPDAAVLAAPDARVASARPRGTAPA